MYTEMGDWAWPTLETPVSVNRSLQEMLLGTGESIEVFPAIPSSWQEAGFLRLIASGGVAVSAARKEGRVQWICLESPGSQSRVLQLPDSMDPDKLCIRAADGVRWQKAGSHGLTVQFPEGSTWLLAALQENTRIGFGTGKPTECHWSSRKPPLR